MPKESTYYKKHETQMEIAGYLANFHSEANARECHTIDDACDNPFLLGYLCSLLQLGVTTTNAEVYFRERRLNPLITKEELARQL